LVARIAAVQASRAVRDATVSANETGGFKYIPGGRESLSSLADWSEIGSREWCLLDRRGMGQPGSECAKLLRGFGGLPRCTRDRQRA
jgi:hypothetical protein